MGIESPVQRSRIDWSDIKDRIDLAAVATASAWPGPRPPRRTWPPLVALPVPRRQEPVVPCEPRQGGWTMLRLLGAWGRRRAGDETSRTDVPRGRPWLAELAGNPMPPRGEPTRPRPPAASPPAKAPESAA